MFKRNEALTDYINRLFAACKGLDRGDYLKHETIEKILGVGRHEAHWKYCVSRLKRKMEEEREISLWPETNIGYRLLTKDEQLIMLPKARIRRARRQIRRAKLSVEAMSDRSLSIHQRRIKAGQLEGLKASQGAILAQVRRQSALEKPIEKRPAPRKVAATTV